MPIDPCLGGVGGQRSLSVYGQQDRVCHPGRYQEADLANQTAVNLREAPSMVPRSTVFGSGAAGAGRMGVFAGIHFADL